MHCYLIKPVNKPVIKPCSSSRFYSFDNGELTGGAFNFRLG